MKLLFAGNYIQASEFAHKHPEDKFHIITDTKQLLAIEHGSTLIITGTYEKNPHFRDVLQLIALRNLRVEHL